MTKEEFENQLCMACVKIKGEYADKVFSVVSGKLSVGTALCVGMAVAIPMFLPLPPASLLPPPLNCP